MNNCLTCQKETLNPKFCSRSCGVSYNNHKIAKRTGQSPKIDICLFCKKEFHHKNAHKFCSNDCCAQYKRLQKYLLIEQLQRIPQSSKSKYVNPNTAKQYLIHAHGHTCSICQISDWMNKPLIMILDHIDGNSDNWQLNNLRLVCSNCDSQLSTYKNRNKNNGRHNRRVRYANGQSY